MGSWDCFHLIYELEIDFHLLRALIYSNENLFLGIFFIIFSDSENVICDLLFVMLCMCGYVHGSPGAHEAQRHQIFPTAGAVEVCGIPDVDAGAARASSASTSWSTSLAPENGNDPYFHLCIINWQLKWFFNSSTNLSWASLHRWMPSIKLLSLLTVVVTSQDPSNQVTEILSIFAVSQGDNLIW